MWGKDNALEAGMSRRVLLAGAAVSCIAYFSAIANKRIDSAIARSAKALAEAMAHRHGGHWRIHIDHDSKFVSISMKGPK